MASVLARLRAVLAVLSNRPLKVRFRRAGEAWFYPADNLVLPVIAGGAPAEDDEDGDKETDKDKEDDDSDSDEKDDEDSDDDSDQDGDKEKDAEYWRRQHRRYERTAKRKRDRDKKELKEAQDKLKEREDEDKSEQEKAVEKAKEEGRSEAETKAEQDRKKDRLEAAVIRAAGKKIEIGEGDDKKQVRFEDPEDAEVFLQRKIAKGDLDEADLFDENGKPKADVISEALQEILEEKPRLAEDSGSGSEDDGKPRGGADQGKGKGSDGDPTDMNDLLRRK